MNKEKNRKKIKHTHTVKMDVCSLLIFYTVQPNHFFFFYRNIVKEKQREKMATTEVVKKKNKQEMVFCVACQTAISSLA